MKPTVNKALCTGCGACESVCPIRLFKVVDGKAKVVKGDGECIGCGACESVCPNKAIELINE